MSRDAPDWVTLTEGETVVWSGHPSLYLVAGRLLAAAILGVAGVATTVSVPAVAPFPLALVVVAFFAVVVTLLAHRSTAYVVTTEEVYEKTGSLSLSVTNLRLDRVQHTSFTQSFLQRVLSYGDVRVDTAGTGETELVLGGVPDPQRVNGLIAEQLGER